MKKFLTISLIFGLTLPVISSLLRPGFFPSHDGEWMVIRLSAFHQALADGQFPVRWSIRLNHGFGYPVLNFLYPLPFYLGEVFYLVTHSFVAATKLVFIFSFFASALAMFGWLRRRYSFWPSLAGTSLYLYTPYRLVDTYVRGSVGESLGFVFIPLVFLAIDLIPRHPRWAVIFGGVSAAALILSHNVFVIFLGLAIIYGLLTLPKKFRLNLLVMLVLAAALSAYFWLPALWELRLVYASRFPVANPIDHLVGLRQLILPSWNYGPANPADSSSMSFQVGLINWFITGLGLLVLARPPLAKLNLFFLSVFLGSIFLMLKISTPFWRLMPGAAQFIQFPWRLLAVTTFTSAYFAAAVATAVKIKFLPGLVSLLAILFTVSYAHPQSTTFLPNAYYATNDDTTTVRGEYLPLWVTLPPKERIPERAVFVTGTGEIVDYTETNSEIHFRVEAVQSDPTAVIKVAQTYYPGWQVTVNSGPVPIDTRYNGVIAFTIPKGQSQILIRWQEPLHRRIVNSISLVTLFGLISHSFYLVLWRHSPVIY